MLVLDKPIRDWESGKQGRAIRNIKSSTNFNIRKLAYCEYVKNVSLIARSEKTPGIYVSASRFEQMEDIVKDVADEIGHNIFDRDEKKRLIGKLTLKGVIPHAFVLRRKKSTEEILSSFDKVINGRSKSLKKLNKIVELNVKEIKSVISRLGIKCMVTQGDGTVQASVVCRAAKELGVKYISVAHGYIQNPYLISICPIRGDYLLTWTKSQKEDIKNVISESEKGKVKYIGCPKHIGVNLESDKFKNALFVSEPINSKLSDERYMNYLHRTKEVMEEKFNDYSFRLHHKESDEVIQYLKSKGFSISENELINDLAKYDVVLGSNTSALFESAYVGNPTFQVKELARFNFDGVNTMSIEKLRRVLSSRDNIVAASSHNSLPKYSEAYIKKRITNIIAE